MNRRTAFWSSVFFLSACRAPRPTVTPTRTDGWEALVVRGRTAEVVIVPAIGRVMQFGLVDGAGGATGAGGARPGPFWRHPGFGPALPPDDQGWINHGGDKAWPAPQSDWARVTGHGWPPPRTFDATPFAATVNGHDVELLSAVDPDYGVRVRRTIALDPAQPVLTIETSYEKVSGPPVRVAVWTITQLGPPDRIFVLLPARSAFPEGHQRRMPSAPKDLRVDGRLLSLERDPAAKTMIASDGDALLWIGDGLDLRVERVASAADGAGARWPDGAHAQVYTSPDAVESYVELELLGPIRELRAGERASLTGRYTLIERRDAAPLAEARRVFAMP